MNAQIQSLLGRLAGLSAAVGVGSFVLSESLYNVDGGQVAVVWHRFNGGVQQYVVGEGTHFREFKGYCTAFWT
jgi:prohibitin 2